MSRLGPEGMAETEAVPSTRYTGDGYPHPPWTLRGTWGGGVVRIPAVTEEGVGDLRGGLVKTGWFQWSWLSVRGGVVAQGGCSNALTCVQCPALFQNIMI